MDGETINGEKPILLATHFCLLLRRHLFSRVSNNEINGITLSPSYIVRSIYVAPTTPSVFVLQHVHTTEEQT